MDRQCCVRNLARSAHNLTAGAGTPQQAATATSRSPPSEAEAKAEAKVNSHESQPAQKEEVRTADVAAANTKVKTPVVDNTMNVSAQIKKNGSSSKYKVRRDTKQNRFDNPFNDRRNKCPWRTSLMAAFLFTVGVVFLSVGLWQWFNTDDRSGAIAMMTLGSISSYQAQFLDVSSVG